MDKRALNTHHCQKTMVVPKTVQHRPKPKSHGSTESESDAIRDYRSSISKKMPADGQETSYRFQCPAPRVYLNRHLLSIYTMNDRVL